MKKSCGIFLFFSLLTTQSCSLSFQIGGAKERGTIVASGVGEVAVSPDVAVFSFTVREEDKDVKIAQKEMSQKAEKAVAKLREKGIKDADIKTSNYSSYPKYSYSPGACDKGICTPAKQIFIGYESSASYQIKVRDLSKAGDILTEIAQLSIAEVSGLSFEVDDMEKFKAEAKALAIAKAKKDAEVTAENLGVSLGRMLSLNDEDFGRPRPMPVFAAMSSMKMSMESAAIPPINSGEEKVIVRVSLTYQIK